MNRSLPRGGPLPGLSPGLWPALSPALSPALLLALVLGLARPLAALEADGVVDWGREATLNAMVSGTVQEVAASRGQPIRQGDLLVRLDPRPFDLELAAARAAVDRATPRLEEARREAERAAELYDRTVLSQHELELARIALAEADADHRQALARLGQARLHKEYSEVRSPVDGLVTELLVGVGEAVVARDRAVPLARVAQTRPLGAVARLPRGEAGGLIRGTPVRVELAGRTWPGEITGLVPAGAAVELLVRFTPEDTGLHFPGTPVRILGQEDSQ